MEKIKKNFGLRLVLTLTSVLTLQQISAQPSIDHNAIKELVSISQKDSKKRLIEMGIGRSEFANSNRIEIDNTTAISQAIEYSDSLNIVRLERMIVKYGYPGKSLVGARNSGSTFTLLAMHNKLHLYDSIIQEALNKGEIIHRFTTNTRRQQ